MTRPDYPSLPPPHGFGVVRLKLLLALCQHPELDTPQWHGRFSAEIGAQGQVKVGAHAALGEVRLEQDSPP